jgi:hypothetical protein
VQTVDPSVDAVVGKLYKDVLGPYWLPEIRHVEEGYRSVAFPFDPVSMLLPQALRVMSLRGAGFAIALRFTARLRPAAPRRFASDPPTLLVLEELPRGRRRPGRRSRRRLRAAVRNRPASWPSGGPPGRDKVSGRRTDRRRRDGVDGRRSAPGPVLRRDHGRNDEARPRARG